MRAQNDTNLPAGLLGVQGKTPLQIRYGICQLEHAMLEAIGRGELQESELPVTHHFTAEGKYFRSVFMPAGATVVGKLHRNEHPFIVHQGRLTVVTEEGGMEHLQAGDRGVSPAGVKRAAYIHEDTIWTCEHEVGELRDVQAIERLIIAKSYTELGMEDPVEKLNLLRG